MKAKLLILTIAYPDACEVLFHVELCNVLHTLAEHGIDVYITRLAECLQNTICLVIFTIRGVVVIGLLDVFTNRTAHVGLGAPSRLVFCSFYCSGCGKSQLLGRSLASFCLSDGRSRCMRCISC